MKDEFADVIAWLASLANLLEIDIEKAALKKYNNRCPKCESYNNYELDAEGPPSPPGQEPKTGSQNPPIGH